MRQTPLLFGLLLVGAAAAAQQQRPPLLTEDFSRPLDPERWTLVRLHDARKDRIEAVDGHLSLGLDSLGTNDSTVKLRGARSRRAFVLRENQPLQVEATFDWNGQRNGSYLTMGIALVRSSSKVAPRRARTSLAFELVGVPPGKNVRPYLWYRKAGGLRPLYTEGWPQPRREDRTGRRIDRARFRLELDTHRVRLFEDQRLLHEAKIELRGAFQVLLFVTGHSNYGWREVRFDDVSVRRGPKPAAPGERTDER